MRAAPAVAALALTACAAAPPPGPPPTPGLVGTGWSLASLGGEAAAAPVTLRFTADRAAGQGPCNRYAAAWSEGPGGAVEIGPVAASRMACPALEMEDRYLGGLTDAARAERAGGALILYGADGAELMRFSGG